MKPVCLIIGAGAGIGGHVGIRFAREGYHVVLCRRSNALGLENLIKEIEQDGGSAEGRLINIVEENAMENLVSDIEKNTGSIEVVIHNIGAQIGNRRLSETPLKTFELGWRLSCFSLFRLAYSVLPLMAQRGKGTLLVTSSTAAQRGNAGQHSHAAAMGGRRMLCQSLNAEFAMQNIHVAHIVIDGAVDAPDTLGKMLGDEAFEKLRQEKGSEDGLMLPEYIADTYYHIAQQHRSVWTHELDLRSFSDEAWWNHAVNIEF